MEDSLSTEARSILEQRDEALNNGRAHDFDDLTKQFRKQKGKDRQKQLMDTLSKDLDVRDRWLGIRQLKHGYQPQPYYRKDTTGNHIKYHNRAQAMAEYLATKQWGEDSKETRQELPTGKM